MRTRIFYPVFTALLLAPFLLGMFSPERAVFAATPFANCQFRSLWDYSDKLVDEVPGAGRGYTWGTNSFGVFQEPYAQSSGGQRTVQYFDKSRMEVAPNGVTNGLLTKELVTGSMQVGDSSFSQRSPSYIPVAGDNNDANPSPTYASFGEIISTFPGQNRAPDRTGQVANLSLDQEGTVSTLRNLPATVRLGSYEPALGHNVPEVFLQYQNLLGRVWDGSHYTYGKIFTENPTSNVFGLPISEAYWVRAAVAGTEKDVLVQLFERRVLTYTPTNSPAYQVEMGNIGQHYFEWRYNGVTGALPDNCSQPSVPASGPAISGYVFALGDSVMLGAAKDLHRVFSDVEIDGAVSRYLFQGTEILKARRDAGQLGDIVVIHLGSNGGISDQQFDDMMSAVSDVRKVVIVNLRVPRSWEGPNNEILANGVRRYRNAVLVDWHAAAANHPEYFWDDGYHLRPDGAKLYADMIAAAARS